MGTVFLVRHGEVQGNTGERQTYVGWDDKPLNETGLAQAEAVAKRLRREELAAVYASDLQRARATAERIAAYQSLKVEPRQDLREANYGVWEGLEVSEIEAGWPQEWRRRQADPVNVAPPEGESYSDVLSRWQPAWQELTLRHSEESIAIVAHNGAIRILLCQLLGMPLQNFRRITLNNCGLTRLEVDADKGAAATLYQVRVRFINETCHLVDSTPEPQGGV
jgi:alpha-ribazole phosphatase/probable phosphoglycerate mutase